MHPQYLGFRRGSSHLVLGFAAQPCHPWASLLGGRNGACAKLGPPWPPAVCSVLLGWVGTGAPERAAPWMGPHQKPAAVWNPALLPRGNSALPLALWASLGEGSRCWVHAPVSTGHGLLPAAWDKLEAESASPGLPGATDAAGPETGLRGSSAQPQPREAQDARPGGGWGSGGCRLAAGFWKAEVGQAHLSRSTANLVVVLPPRVVFLLFLT